MSTVNFSVPDEVKDEFNAVFSGQNKSAIIAELMREAVERARRKERSREAIGQILGRRERAPVVTEISFRKARESGRP
jgi:metal-responsive CopG/Arc/MetJ family transcriptional regulator